MLHALINLVLKHRQPVLLLTLAAAVIGAAAALRLPMDAVPDITQPQVQVTTPVPGLAPEEVETLVTLPLESEMAGLPGMVELRSLSKAGLSQVTMTFHDGADLYRLRQLVSERLLTARDELPDGVNPRLAPIATGLGEIYYYALDFAPGVTNRPGTREEQLRDLRRIQEQLVKPLLRATPGVAEVNTSGGYERQIVVQPDPARLAAAGLTFDELVARLEENTSNAGGGFLETGGERIVIRTTGRAGSLADLESIPLKFAGQPAPLLVRDVADVAVGSALRTGASTVDGTEAVVGAAIMLAGENTRVVAAAVRERITDIAEKLPAGVEIRPLYDRGDLVSRTLRTVGTNLAEGALLVIVILFALLGNWRAAVIVALVIPLSLLLAMTGMTRLGITGNLMSLGAIDFGLIIDGAVVMVENIVRHLGDRQRALGRPLDPRERLAVTGQAAREVASPMFFGVLIITVVYVPVLALQGIEGRMFVPMAVVVMLALGASLALALTLMPVLCSWCLGGTVREEHSRLVGALATVYRPLLDFGLRHRAAVLVPLATALALALFLATRLGWEFIPQLDEGDFAFQLIRGNSVGLDASLELQRRSESLLLREFPEIRTVFSRIGTAEVATDPMSPNVADTYVLLHPPRTWRMVDGRRISKEDLGALMRRRLLAEVPGQSVLITQPIQMRFNEIMAGARADLVCKLHGPDLAELERLAGEVRTVLASLPGGAETEFDSIGNNPMLEVQPDRDAMRRRNVHAADLNRAVSAALAGADAGSVMENGRPTPVVVRLDETRRNDPASLARLPFGTDDGTVLGLGTVARVALVEQPAQIARENTSRRVNLLVTVRGRDTAGFVAEATRALHARVTFPDGYYFEFGGQFRNLVEARERLALVVPAALALIFGLLYLSFGSLRQALLILLCVPLAALGGVLALWLRGLPFTVSAAVGFIALSGIAALNGIMLLSFINQLREQGRPLGDAVREGTLTRLRPKLMTALVASLGFVPMALATGAGAEVQRPLATVVIGGIVTSTFLTLLVVPVLYEWIESKRKPATPS